MVATSSVRHGSVMIVDDEPDTVESLTEALQESLKIHVVTASNPKEALAMLKEQPVHLILSDYQMPGMNGYELLREAQKIYPGVHLMLMTGHPKLAEVDARMPRLEGAFAKPLNAQKLIRAIREQIPTVD
jgi:DNA-binding NtrC family response regulator